VVVTAVTAALRSAPPEILPIIGSRQPFGYRNQAKLVLRRTGAGVLAGLYAPGSHRVVDTQACAVHHPAINRAIAATVALLEESGASIYDERTGRGGFRYLVVRQSLWHKQTQVVLVAAEQPSGLAAFVRGLRRRCRGVTSVVLNLNPGTGNVIFGSRWLPLGGSAAIVERVGDVKLQARAGAFLQANPWVAARLYRTIAGWVGGAGSETVVDLYAGIGAIALSVAPAVRRVFAIEENEIAAGDARSNARRNGVSNLRVLAGTVEDALPRLRREIGRADVVTLNPPRGGAGASLLAEVVALRPRALVYLSCDVTTLTRDLTRLAQRGYRTLRVQPADMLPQTAHVECLALAVPQADP
jgi:23S rRNA (uracil1939-C5)-methyltransferase